MESILAFLDALPFYKRLSMADNFLDTSSKDLA